MRTIQVKKDGKWINTEIVNDDQSNKIVRALNREGHTARSIKTKVFGVTVTGAAPKIDKPARSYETARITAKSDQPAMIKLKFASAKPSRMLQDKPARALHAKSMGAKRNSDAIDKLMQAPHALTKPEGKRLKKLIAAEKSSAITVLEVEKAVRNVAKANREKSKTDAGTSPAQLAAMLKIEGAGRMEDPRRCGLDIHAGTLRTLVERGSVVIGINNSLHLSIPGRRELLGAVAKIVAPNPKRMEYALA